ncbi:hypothetical protein HIM_09772 [Hirsutella minnesotensis 3608]|uniref:CCHC-type domain-containing protein n=1 Tax=Hirsutella minnesotensis 3608 TaxID=1043627 RepID=A0A0F7ZS72_9HYPO|nr:hypothetical protein HIM_09772 [Hirsutella minnesotensis 3608]
MAPASGSHADSNASRQGIRPPPDSAARKSHLKPSFPTEARRNDSLSPVQQPTQSISRTETPEAAVTEGAQLDEVSNLLKPTNNAERAPISITEAVEKIARDQTAAHDARLAVLRALSEAFEQATRQFTSDAENSIAKQAATKFLNFWNQSLTDLGEPPKPTYSSVLASGRKPKGQLPVTAPAPLQRKQQTAIRLQERPPVAPPKEDLGVFVRLDADARHETTKDTQSGPTSPLESALTCAASRRPSRLTDLRGVEINYEEAVKEETTCQTGLKPISVRPSRHDSGGMPTKTLIVSFMEPAQRPWRLFGASRLARYIDKPSIPSQCDKCWDFHARHSCDRTARCRRCGKTDHRGQECAALEQCANCLGPHCADEPKCPARPKRAHGMVRRLTREERRLVRQAGAQLFAQQRMQTTNHNVPEQSRQNPDSSQLRPSEPQAAGEDGSSGRNAAQERAAPSPPCIVVATTPPSPPPASHDNQFALHWPASHILSLKTQSGSE